MREKLFELRVKNRLSQDAFGAMVGFRRETVSAVEKGQRDPSFKYMKAVQMAFNIPADEMGEVFALGKE